MAGNLHLARAKLYLYRLVTSHEVYIEGNEQVPMAFSTPSEFPEQLRFKTLRNTPDISSLPWGADALAASFEEARELFNKALPAFKAAMEHYQLDGWVTEHCNILMEISNLYRWGGLAPAVWHAFTLWVHRWRRQVIPFCGCLGDCKPSHSIARARPSNST